MDGAPHDTNIRYIDEPMDALDDSFAADHTSTKDTGDLVEAMEREIAINFISQSYPVINCSRILIMDMF